MYRRAKKLFIEYRAERRRVRELKAMLDNLVDPTFLNRAIAGDAMIKLYEEAKRIGAIK